MPSYAITGTSRGIGYEFVRQLSSSPENVIFAIVRNRKTATSLEQLNRPNVHVLEADVADYTAVKAIAQEASKINGGKLDVLINNAAYFRSERAYLALDTYPEGREEDLETDLREMFDVNVIGVVHVINAFLPLLRAGNMKKVIAISSSMGDSDFILKSGFTHNAPYSISKAAVNMVIAKYAVKYKAEGFVFLALSPGLVNTSLQKPTPEQMVKQEGMIAALRKITPTFEGPMTPETSVQLQLQVISKCTVEDTGILISHHGNKEWL